MKWVRALPPRWENARAARDDAARFFMERGLPPSEADALAMATSELFENAIKYGAWAARDAQVVVELEATAGRALVAVTSPCADAAALEAHLAWLRAFATAKDAYLARMREIAQSGDRRASGLGLARIAAEAGCELRCERRAGKVTVRAQRKGSAP